MVSGENSRKLFGSIFSFDKGGHSGVHVVLQKVLDSFPVSHNDVPHLVLLHHLHQLFCRKVLFIAATEFVVLSDDFFLLKEFLLGLQHPVHQSHFDF